MIPPVFALLTAASPVTDIVDERIYRHAHAPQDALKPYITWSVVGGHAENYLAQRPGIDQELVQIDCWSTTAQECKTLMLAVVAALELDGHQQGMPQDDFEQDTQLYRVMLQFHFWTPR